MRLFIDKGFCPPPSKTTIHPVTMDAFDFLETLPNATLERLYEDPWACQAVFQALPPLAQQFVMRLLSCDAPVPQQVLAQWVRATPSGQLPPQFDHALQKVRDQRRLPLFTDT